MPSQLPQLHNILLEATPAAIYSTHSYPSCDRRYQFKEVVLAEEILFTCILFQIIRIL